MERFLTASRIHVQPARLLTLSGSAASRSISRSMAAFFLSMLPYTSPSTLRRSSSNTLFDGFSSGAYEGCSINISINSMHRLTPTSFTCRARWLGALSQINTSIPSSCHSFSTGEPAARPSAARPPFSTPPALPKTLGRLSDGAPSSSISNVQTPSACPSRCTKRRRSLWPR